MQTNVIYFEKQSLWLCGMHSVNGLLQAPVYTSKDMDELAEQISLEKTILNPHKNMFGLGNYDGNVLIAALEIQGKKCQFYDKRRSNFTLEGVELDQLCGLLVNYQTKGLFSPKCHWVAYLYKNNMIYNLDSKQKSQPMGQELPVIEYEIDTIINNKQGNVILVLNH